LLSGWTLRDDGLPLARSEDEAHLLLSALTEEAFILVERIDSLGILVNNPGLVIV
jgi:hypothetical protein